MYAELTKIHHRPQPFSVYTADVLWTAPHLAQQMLHYHLNQDTDLASRRMGTIDRVVVWIDQTFTLDGKAVCDLGCGPGLYAGRFAQRGAEVFGLDFSANSIAYAQQAADDAGQDIHYAVGDYLKTPLPAGQDLVTLIYCDLCALSPQQRQMLYTNVRQALRPGGSFLFDVMSAKAFAEREDACTFARGLMDGFWAEGDYFAFHHTFTYGEQKLVLDQFTIIEEDRSWQVFNWLQHFSPEDIVAELLANGFADVQVIANFGNVSSDDESYFAVIAKA